MGGVHNFISTIQLRIPETEVNSSRNEDEEEGETGSDDSFFDDGDGVVKERRKQLRKLSKQIKLVIKSAKVLEHGLFGTQTF
jgi:hypothetical protein